MAVTTEKEMLFQKVSQILIPINVIKMLYNKLFTKYKEKTVCMYKYNMNVSRCQIRYF